MANRMETLREGLHSQERPKKEAARPASWLKSPERLAEMEKRGLIKRGKGKIPADFLGRARPADPQGDVLAALLDERYFDQ